ncbi:MAG TPA: L,D-transpeptidase [Ignavibacteriaceae bacterium]|nr:L,D-transpeptidase [Ignavibacteriaceae bacterium]
MKRTNKIYLASIVLTAIIFFNSAYLNKSTSELSPKEFNYSFHPFAGYDFKQLRDTVYTNKDHYIEVNLATQHATLYSRDGSEFQFPISSGTKRIEKGMETNQGLFAIQWKSKKQYSVQFDSTVMLNWMGFNNGIGFHALLGKSYYKYLGKKNVSHGCVRVSREDAQIVYQKVEKGTPVFVHKGNSAIKIAFTSEGESYNQYSYSETYNQLRERYQKLYDGDYLISSNEKILIDEKNLTHNGLPLGNSELIPAKQNLKPSTLWVDRNKPEEDKLVEIFSGRDKELLTLNTVLDSRN